MRPRQRCSIGEGEDRWVLRYSTASWRMMLPCLSMQWKLPKKNRPSLIPTSIRRNSNFLARDTISEEELSVACVDDDISISSSIYFLYFFLLDGVDGTVFLDARTLESMVTILLTLFVYKKKKIHFVWFKKSISSIIENSASNFKTFLFFSKREF